MSGRLQKKINPRVAALLVLVVLAAVQWVWWRGLVYREPGVRTPMGGGGGMPPLPQNIPGRADVNVETFAGDLEPGDADGQGYAARFDRPTGLAIDSQGSLYVADTGNHRIRKIAPDGQTTTLAGSEAGFVDGPALQARFYAPCGVSVTPEGVVYVADTGNHCIRRIQEGQVTTVAGKPPAPGERTSDGARQMTLPSGVAYVPGAEPFLLVADTGGRRIRRYRMDGSPESEQKVPGAPTAVVGTPRTAVAIPQSGMLLLGAQTLRNVRLEEDDTPPGSGQNDPFILRHPVALWSLGDGWLVTDNGHGAVFLVRNGKAEVLAGVCTSFQPIRGSRDGDGSHALFSYLGGIVADGRRYAYVADTANNTIRRLTITEVVGR
jgi:hypothetical protein